MTKRDHDSFRLAAAFFKESIRRDAIAGMKTVLALYDPG